MQKYYGQCPMYHGLLVSLLHYMCVQKYYGRGPMYHVFLVSLRVGAREFLGEGATAQQAKHNAAAKVRGEGVPGQGGHGTPGKAKCCRQGEARGGEGDPGGGRSRHNEAAKVTARKFTQ